MDITELGAIGELVGGVAVIGTLAYLSVQVHQSTRSSRSATYQAAVASISDWTRCIGADASLATLIHKGSQNPAALSEEEHLQYVYLVTSLVRNFENIHYQYENGSLDETNWDPWAARIRGFFGAAGNRHWWVGQRTAYSPTFREFVDESSGEATPLPNEIVQK